MNSSIIPEFRDVKEKRKWLSALSKPIKSAVSSGEVSSVNEAIMEMYQDEFPEEDFNTFHGWKKQGYTIKKGARAFLVWGQPKAIKPKEKESGTEEEEDEEQFFPIAHLFSSLQVKKLKKAV